MAKRMGRKLAAKTPASKEAPPVLPAKPKPQQRRGLRMRINADGGMDIHHLMTDGGMFVPELVEVTLSDSDTPVWIQVAKAGRFNKGGPFELNEQVFSDIVRNFASTANRRIPIDFEHASEADPTEGSIPTLGAPAQGWITALDIRDGGSTLWALVEWLPRARQYIKEGSYKYFSPAIRFNARDRNTGAVIGARMTSGALTNNPFLDGMAPLAATDLLAARDFETNPLTETEASDGAVELSWDIESPNAPRLALEVNVLQAMEGIRDIISAILPCEEDECEEEDDELPSAPSNPIPMAPPVFQAPMTAQQCADRQPSAIVAAAKEQVPTMDNETISLKDHTAKVAELQLTLKDVESKLALKDEQIAKLESDIVALRDAETKRLADANAKRVDAAFEQYKDIKKLTDLDKEAMSYLIAAKPETFEKLYPVVSAQKQILSARISTERPAQQLPDGVARPDVKTLVAKYQGEGKSYDEAFTLAMRDLEPKKI